MKLIAENDYSYLKEPVTFMDYPKKYLITSGCGKSQYELVAFDEALRNAEIGDYNLVKISSILPAGCQQATSDELPRRGSGLLTAFGTLSTNEKGVRIASAVSVAIPEDPDEVGVIMEYSGYCGAEQAENQVCLMAKEAMDNRGRAIKEILSSSAEATVDGAYASVVSAICIW